MARPILVLHESTREAAVQQEKLGVTIGGVIIDRAHDGTSTSFWGDDSLKTTPVPGTFAALRRLVAERFGDRVYLVSKTETEIRDRTRLWLTDHQFYLQTGIHPHNMRFCKIREENALICAELGITHFIDDRLEVLGYLKSVPHKFLFQGPEVDTRRLQQALPGVQHVQSWEEITALLLPKI